MDEHRRIEREVREAEGLLRELGPDFQGLRAQATDLLDRLEQGRLRVAVFGQFKRGKSTLLNALLGEPLLPMGVLPLTAVPARLCYGPERQLTVHRHDGPPLVHRGSIDDLQAIIMLYGTERGNAGNHRHVTELVIEHPSSLLQQGVEIIDTPGVGSTILQNTQAARTVLPTCDAALFVLSPDPPITEVELEFVAAVKAATARVMFVLTKADMMTLTSRQEIVSFVRQTLHERVGYSQDERIFVVSALQGLQARVQSDAQLLVSSGVSALETYLAEFLASEKRQILKAAITSKAAHLIGEALFLIDLRRKMLDLPKEDLKRRLSRFEAQLGDLDAERLHLADQLEGERRRLTAELDALADEIAIRAEKELLAIADSRRGSGPLSAARYAAVRDAVFSQVPPLFARYREEMVGHTSQRLKMTEAQHGDVVKRLVHRIRQTAADVFEVADVGMASAVEIGTHIDPMVFPHPYVTSFLEQTMTWLVRWLPRILQARYYERQLREDIRSITRRNTGELRWAIAQALPGHFARLQQAYQQQLQDAAASIRHAIARVLAQQQQSAQHAVPEVQRLMRYRDVLRPLLNRLSSSSAPHTYGSRL